MKIIARTRAEITDPTIHLFLLILFDMAVKIFLLLSMALSTPCSCKTPKNKITLKPNQHIPYSFCPVHMSGPPDSLIREDKVHKPGHVNREALTV